MAAVQNHQKPQCVICTHITDQGGVGVNKVNKNTLFLHEFNFATLNVGCF